MKRIEDKDWRSAGGSGVFRAVAVFVASCAVVVVAGGGCNIVGPVMVLAEGPPKTEAKVELDDTRTYVILVDDMRSRLPKRSLRDVIAQSAEETLLEEGAVSTPNLIAARAVQRAMVDDRSGKPKSIAEIGKDAGANVVIYVTMDSWGLTRDGRSAAPTAEGRIKIIDCDTNQRLWPPIEAGYSLRVAPTMQQGDLPDDLAGRSRVEQELAKRFGVAVAQLFFTHENSKSATR